MDAFLLVRVKYAKRTNASVFELLTAIIIDLNIYPRMVI